MNVGLFATAGRAQQHAAARLADRQLGEAHGYLLKSSADAQNTTVLRGRLVVSRSGWLLLEVPNDFIRGLFATIAEPGTELPYHSDGRLNAHISVMSKDEVDQLGGPDKISERGKLFGYQLGPVQTVVPTTWNDVSRVWFVRVHSPELQQLRRTYGLTPLPHDGQYNFHITFAVRKRKVLGNNPVSKAAAWRLADLANSLRDH